MESNTVIIKILKFPETESGEIQLLDTITIEKVDVFRVKPIKELVGTPLSLQKISELISQIQPSESLNKDEPELYYSQEVELIKDGNLLTVKMDIPHYISIRIVLESVLKTSNMFKNIRIEIT